MSTRRLVILILLISLSLIGVNYLDPKYQIAVYFLKPLVVLLMIAKARSDRRKASDLDYANKIITALSFSLIGDIVLMFDLFWCFIVGMIFFFLAHLSYISAFRLHYAWGKHNLFALAFLLFLGTTALVWLGPFLGTMLIPVFIYLCAILAMCYFAIISPQPFTGLGAFLFIISDSLIAIHKFVQPISYPDLWILGTYYLAQFLFLKSIEKRP